MKKLIIISFVCLLFSNCQKYHYYCVCVNPNYSKDYGRRYFANKTKLTADCNTHKVNAKTSCAIGF